MSDLKQVIVWRSDLKEMPLGKKMAQAAHAAHLFMTEKIKTRSPSDQDFVHEIKVEDEEKAWVDTWYKKVVVIVRSEAELQIIYAKAKELGLRAHIVTDLGLTVFKEPTVTCMAIGPNDADEIDKVTGEKGPLGKLRLA